VTKDEDRALRRVGDKLCRLLGSQNDVKRWIKIFGKTLQCLQKVVCSSHRSLPVDVARRFALGLRCCSGEARLPLTQQDGLQLDWEFSLKLENDSNVFYSFSQALRH